MPAVRQFPKEFPTFTSTESGATDRGREFGAAWRDEIHTGLDKYLALFRAYGVARDQVRAWSDRAVGQLAAWAPELGSEVSGIAAGAGMPLWQVGAINARTEILAAARATGLSECSTAVVLPGDGEPPRTIQTWDWNESLRDAPVAWAYEPRPGVAVRGFTEFGMLGKIGVNSTGLGVHFNLLRHVSDHDAIGVPVHAVARRILDRATDIYEATEIARSARLSASTVLTVVAFNGTGAYVRGLELSPAGVGIVDDEDGFFVHTNHFLDPDLSKGEWLGVERPTTYDRLKHLRGQADRLGSADLMERVGAMLSHAEDGALVCRHPLPDDPLQLRSETLATISLDLAECRLAFHPGGPCNVTVASWQHF
jgi:isopenicillin-N N-acyltransferase-like protein